MVVCYLCNKCNMVWKYLISIDDKVMVTIDTSVVCCLYSEMPNFSQRFAKNDRIFFLIQVHRCSEFQLWTSRGSTDPLIANQHNSYKSHHLLHSGSSFFKKGTVPFLFQHKPKLCPLRLTEVVLETLPLPSRTLGVQSQTSRHFVESQMAYLREISNV